MTTVYTTTVKRKEQPKEKVTYQPFVCALCQVHDKMETVNLDSEPTFDNAKNALQKELKTTSELSHIYFGGILETITKGEDYKQFVYVLNPLNNTVYNVTLFDPDN